MLYCLYGENLLQQLLNKTIYMQQFFNSRMIFQVCKFFSEIYIFFDQTYNKLDTQLKKGENSERLVG